MPLTARGANYKRIRLLFWCAALVLAASDVWVARNAMSPDGVSYLDMGDAFFHRNWHMAINAYWSPLYPWVEGFFLWALKPSAHWEFPLVHLVNLFIFIGALASFEFFLRAFIDLRKEKGKEPETDGGLPEWAWYVIGYSLFIWTSLIMIGDTSNVSPDLCVTALVYLAFGFLLRMRSRTATWGTFVLFGIVLGFAYLAKAVMFPLAFVFLAVAALSLPSLHKAAPRVLLSALVFATIASPWFILLSRAEGHPTFGESGRVNYEYKVDGYPLWFPSAAALKHPVPKLVDSPPTYSFAEPVGGTYPLWYDTSYWHAGLTPRFIAKGELRAVDKSVVKYLHLVLSPRMQLYLLAGLLALFWLNHRWLDMKAVGSNWPVVVPALAAIGGYALVVTDWRYVAAYIVVAWMVLFSGTGLPGSGRRAKLASAVVLALGVFSFYRPLYAEARKHTPASWAAAVALNEDGIKPGDRIAVIGRETFGMYIARLARTQITAEVREETSRFCGERPQVQTRVIEALQRAGAAAILASAKALGCHANNGWHRLGKTQYALYYLAGTNP